MKVGEGQRLEGGPRGICTGAIGPAHSGTARVTVPSTLLMTGEGLGGRGVCEARGQRWSKEAEDSGKEACKGSKDMSNVVDIEDIVNFDTVILIDFIMLLSLTLLTSLTSWTLSLTWLHSSTLCVRYL